VTLATIAATDGATETGLTGGGGWLDNRQPTIAITYVIATQGTFPDGDQPGSLTTTPDRTTQYLGEIKAIPFDFVPSGDWAMCDGQLLSTASNLALFQLLGTTYGGNGTTTFALPDLRGRLPMGAGQGPGLPNYNLGQVVGNALPVLTVANLPAHRHTIPGGQTALTGSGTPVDNRQSSLAVNFYIAGDGEIMIAAWSRGTSEWMLCDGRLLNIAGNTTFFSNLGTYYGGNGITNFAIPDLRGRVVMGDDDASSYIGATPGSNDLTLGISDVPSHAHALTSGNTAATGGAGNSAPNYQPSLVMHWVISLFGSFPNPNSGGIQSPIIGELRLIAGARSTGLGEGAWVSSDGSLLPINENDTLFIVLGTRFGGDGQDTFALPDFGASVAEGPGGVTVQGTTTELAETLGSPTLNISIDQLASHRHSLLELQIIDIQHFTDDSAQLTLTGTIGYTAQVEYSPDLSSSSWNNLGAVLFTSATMPFPDANSSHAQKRFYRAYFP